MIRTIHTTLLLAFVLSLGATARSADAPDERSVVERAIKAAGGQEKLSHIKAMTWKAKGTLSIGGADNDFTSETTIQGLDHVKAVFHANFNGNEIEAMTVIAGNKGWRRFGDMKTELDKDAIANEKRMIYLQWIPTVLLPLSGKEFQTEGGAEEQVAGKPAVTLKVTAPDHQDFTIYFDKASGLPVKQVAKVVGFSGEDFTQETIYGGYKEVDGITKATKIESRRDGQKFVEYEISDFKALEKVDAETFKEPE
jgi:hypothetical protein